MNDQSTGAMRRDAYDSGPGWIVIGDQAALERRGAMLLEAAGGRVLRSSSLRDGVDVIGATLMLDGILLMMQAPVDACGDRLLAMIAQRAALDGLTVLVDCPLTSLDAVCSHATGRDWHLMCGAPDVELLATLGWAMSAEQQLVADVANEADAIRLQRLADEVSRIARTLANLSPLDSFCVAPAPSPFRDAAQSFRQAPLRAADPQADASDIRAMIRVRRLRDRFFQPELFADPAWDMLLDLTAARLEQAQVAVSSLCIAAAVPPTTALRWIKAMTDQGLFERCADPDDGRRIFIRLADSAAEAMFAFLTAAKRQGGQMV